MKIKLYKKNGYSPKGDFAVHNIRPYGTLWEVVVDEEGLPVKEKCLAHNILPEELDEEAKQDTIWYYKTFFDEDVSEEFGF